MLTRRLWIRCYFWGMTFLISRSENKKKSWVKFASHCLENWAKSGITECQALGTLCLPCSPLCAGANIYKPLSILRSIVRAFLRWLILIYSFNVWITTAFQDQSQSWERLKIRYFKYGPRFPLPALLGCVSVKLNKKIKMCKSKKKLLQTSLKYTCLWDYN